MDDADINRLLDRLCRVDGRVVYFPVRHHSPMAAKWVARLIASTRSAAVLVEGPSDYNGDFDELHLGHSLPVAIYTYFRRGGESSGAYYPFCEYSPEWVAITRGREAGADVRFIDLPWAEVSLHDRTAQRYADGELRYGRYINALCARLNVEGFDDFWDTLVESHPDLTLDDYLRRVHTFCFQARLWEEHVSVADRRREAFMADEIRRTLAETPGTVLVVTGGFHSSALAARLEGLPCPGIDDSTLPGDENAEPAAERGIALTTYSYDRLDRLTGYDAGMPNPGFYEQVWYQRDDAGFSHRPLLVALVEELRKRGQTLSTADLIAVETSARALASLRARPHVWRRDLIDAVISSLLKDELEYEGESPFLRAVHAVLRGRRQGRLAEGTRLPPLVQEIRRELAAAGLDPLHQKQTVDLNLLEANDLAKSRLLHRLKLLEIRGLARAGGSDFLQRQDLTRLWERWEIRWSHEFIPSCVEASRYGTSLADAVAARLAELARGHQRDAAAAAALLVQAAQADVATLSRTLLDQLDELIEQEGRFESIAVALGHLLYLYRYDEALGTAERPEIGGLLATTFGRSLWLLELVGKSAPTAELLKGMRTLLEAFQKAGERAGLGREELVHVLERVEGDAGKPPALRGAAAGILWTLGAADESRLLADLLGFAAAEDLGDFLAGLFAVAREVAQRHAPLVQTVDRLLLEFGADDFQAALPPLRLAFTYFTPREKHYMLKTLFESLGITAAPALAELSVDEAAAIEVLAFEERLFELVDRYRLGPE